VFLGIFCDLFAHRLIALKDDQFLKNHTPWRLMCLAHLLWVIILAEEVIVRVAGSVVF
jgi:hypothetical protein